MRQNPKNDRELIWLCPVNVVGCVNQIPTTYVGGQIGLPSDRWWPRPPAGRRAPAWARWAHGVHGPHGPYGPHGAHI